MSNLKMSLGDIADRYSICLLKSQRGSINVNDELSALKTEIDSNGLHGYVEELYKVNGEIWTLESDIRQGKEGLMTLEEIGKRALLIRDFNKIRVDIKNKINIKHQSGFIEYKKFHASE